MFEKLALYMAKLYIASFFIGVVFCKVVDSSVLEYLIFLLYSIIWRNSQIFG